MHDPTTQTARLRPGTATDVRVPEVAPGERGECTRTGVSDGDNNAFRRPFRGQAESIK